MILKKCFAQILLLRLPFFPKLMTKSCTPPCTVIPTKSTHHQPLPTLSYTSFQFTSLPQSLSLSLSLTMDPDQEIQFEMPHVLRLYKSGRVERFFTQAIPASTDPVTGVISKDVVINPSTGLWVRIYLPNLTPTQKLPIVVYYHGGAFMIGSASDPFSHSYVNKLTADAKIIAVSVNYRLAPEYPMPIGYDDSSEALKWVLSHANGAGSEPWLLKHGDFGKVFLTGCSAGATIAHTVALRAGSETLEPGVTIKGMALIHAYFSGKELIGSEVNLSPEERAKTEEIWNFVCPGSTAGLDDPLTNPFAEGAPNVKALACKRVMVSVAELDPLRDRGVWYYEKLKESGWEGEAELHETKGEGHAFHVFKIGSEKGAELQARTIEFLNK